MKLLRSVVAASFVLLSASALFASDPASPPPDNSYQVVEESVVTGQFKGCNPQVGIPIKDKLFICTTFGFSPAMYYPKVVVLKNRKGEYKVLINGVEYKGYFYSGSEAAQ